MRGRTLPVATAKFAQQIAAALESGPDNSPVSQGV
jgi:hypothetical protein